MISHQRDACIDCGSSPCTCPQWLKSADIRAAARRRAHRLAAPLLDSLCLGEHLRDDIPSDEERAKLSKRLVESLKKGGFTLTEDIARNKDSQGVDGEHHIP